MKEKEAKYDFLGNELHIGDEIVFMEVGYRNLLKGKITSLREKKASIDIISPPNTHWHKAVQFYNQIIKITK